MITLLAPGGCQRHVDATTQPTPRDDQPLVPLADVKLELTGAGLSRPRVFTYADLLRMEMVHLDRVLMQRSQSPDLWTAWRGPALAKLLQDAGLRPGAMTFRLEGRDGYRVRCVAEELRAAIVALEDGGGRRLGETDPSCPLRLVVPNQPANFWIINIARIEVEPVTTASESR